MTRKCFSFTFIISISNPDDNTLWEEFSSDYRSDFWLVQNTACVFTAVCTCGFYCLPISATPKQPLGMCVGKAFTQTFHMLIKTCLSTYFHKAQMQKCSNRYRNKYVCILAPVPPYWVFIHSTVYNAIDSVIYTLTWPSKINLCNPM